MSYPCVDPDHFVVDGSGALSPQPYLQWRHVATNAADSIQHSYVINGGNQAADLLSLQVAWTNPDPVPMSTYCILTRGGSTVKTAARTRAYIETYYGQASGVSPADPATSTLIGRTGSGVDGGTEVISSTTYTRWAATEVRQAEHSQLVGPFFTIPQGQTLKTKVRLRWDAAFWESGTYFVAGSSEAELSVMTGATRLDLYALPLI